MNRSDGIRLASAAAALLLGGCGENPSSGAVAQGTDQDSGAAQSAEGPVKVAHCDGVLEDGLVAITTGNANFSGVMCQVLGGNQVTATSAAPGEHPEGAPAALTHCNDVFTCAGLSACKGNDNASCAGQNDCHGIGFVGVYSPEKSVSDELCQKLGGTVLSSI